jgi:transposase
LRGGGPGSASTARRSGGVLRAVLAGMRRGRESNIAKRRQRLPKPRYRLAEDHGWDVVDEYELQRDTPHASSRKIAAAFKARGTKISYKFVQRSIRRWRECGDPTQTGRGGSTLRQANRAERIWLKQLLRKDPDLYFHEVRKKFVAKWRWEVSDAMISKALHFEGERLSPQERADGIPGVEMDLLEDEDFHPDEELTLKVLERMARQRNSAERERCFGALTGAGALPQCYIIMDESSIGKSTLRRRRGWSPRGQPAKLYEMFEVRGSGKLRSLMAAVNEDGFVLGACKLVEGGVLPAQAPHLV